MLITTWTIAKGIPPRLHEPKSTAKTANKGISKVKQTRKQVASESEPASDAEDSEPARKKGRDKKWQHVAAIGGPEVEVESVDKDAEPAEKEVEEEDANGNGGQDDQDDQEEVSMDSWAHATTHWASRRMTSMNISMGLTSKNSWRRRIQHLTYWQWCLTESLSNSS